MSLTPTFLMLTVLFSSIGLGYFIYGKKRGKPVVLLVGILLMASTYFLSNVILIIASGILLIGRRTLSAVLRATPAPAVRDGPD
mgnify:CR=1 FL=1